MPGRISLPELKIASPCPARWADMRGDDRTRFCEACGKHVHNFAAMREAEIAGLLDGRPICAQLYRRPDGTILTADCPVGLRLARSRLGRSILRAAAASLGLLATATSALGFRSISERIASPDLRAMLRQLEAPAVAGGLAVQMGDLGPPATQAVRGEVSVEPAATLGRVALPSTRPATRPTP